MKFTNDKGQPVEINFQNFERILPGAKACLTPIKFKDGREERVRATDDEILHATAEEQPSPVSFHWLLKNTTEIDAVWSRGLHSGASSPDRHR